MRTLLDDNIYNHELAERAQTECLPQLFLLTRFNISVSGAREKGGLQEEDNFRSWCEQRSRIFTAVCLPSVLSQTILPRGWLILFDERYMAEVQIAIDAVRHYEWIVPIIIKVGEPVPTYRHFFCPEIATRLDGCELPIITTRMDNDDAIARTFIESTRRYAAAALRGNTEVPFWITFPYGAQWDGATAALMVMNNNPFLSLVESASTARSQRLRTAMSVNHGHVFSHGRVLTATPRIPMWLQYVHSGNVSNRRNCNLLSFQNSDAVLRPFGLMSNIFSDLPHVGGPI